MKRFFISIMSLILGVSGYAVVEKTIEDRVGILESQVSELQYEVSSLKTPITEVTTDKDVTEEITTDPFENMTVEEILDFYSLATAKVVKEKPGYTKFRIAGNETYNAGGALLPFKTIVFSFLGIGDENKFEETVAKGTNTNDDQCGDYLKQSTLTATDVTSAKMVKSGNNYVITIAVKGGTSYIEGGDKASNSSPIDKTGICIGTTDRSGFDHKNAVIVYNAIKDFAGTAVIDEETRNGKVVATVTPDGKITKLVISWDARADLSKILASKGYIEATTTVTYTNFGW